MSTTSVVGYEHRAIGLVYDVLNRLLWLPQGSDRLRRALVDALGVGPKDHVLELGCGTGLVTRHFVGSGAKVTAIDGALTMLGRARRRAPAAAFEHRDLRAGVPDGPFDAVALSFLLHELDPPTRLELLRKCAAQLARGGRIGILEWATPSGAVRARVWRRVVRAIEPKVAHDVLDDALRSTILEAGLTITSVSSPASGRAQILLVSRSDL